MLHLTVLLGVFLDQSPFKDRIVTSKKAGQIEGPQWSCHKMLLIFCTVSHVLLKTQNNCSYLSVTVAFVFAF